MLSKSLGAQGGLVAGSSVLREHLIDTACTFIFDTGLNPAAASALAALRILRAQPDYPDRLRSNAIRLAERCGAATRPRP